MKTNYCFNVIGLSLLYSTHCGAAEAPKPVAQPVVQTDKAPQLSKAFLIYLAELEKVDDQWIGPLDIETPTEQTNRNDEKVKCDRSKDECKK